jgi:phosphosulfolactate synthase
MLQAAQSLEGYLSDLGVADLSPHTSPLDPGYDPATLESHLEQSAHLISVLKLSMACWQIANESATRAKLASARKHGVKVTAGGGPFEVAAACGRLPQYLDLCAGLGLDRIEAGQGFTDTPLDPRRIVALADARGLDVQFEIGEKHTGPFTPGVIAQLIDQGQEWLDAGALQILVEARESARGVGLFDAEGQLDYAGADDLVSALGLERLCFEAPHKAAQFALIDHFGPGVHLSNVRLEEILRVEIYRRGLHSDSFRRAQLRPRPRQP